MKHTLLNALVASLCLASTHADDVSRIYIADRDGKNLTMIADDIAVAEHQWIGSPAWSPDGGSIVFDATKDHKFSHTRMLRMQLAGPEKGKLTDLGVGLCPVYSPDGKRLAFFLNGKNPMNAKSGLWVMDADGANRQRVSWGLYPQWAPDGKSILCVSSHKNPRKLYLFEGEKFKRRELLTNEVVLGVPTWAPDGKRFAVSVKDGDNRVMAVFQPEEKSTSRKILWRGKWHGGYEETWPDWSPDGQRIALTTYPREAGRSLTEVLYLDAAKEDQPVLLNGIPVSTRIRDCQWSPDGARIAFAAGGGEILARAKRLRD